MHIFDQVPDEELIVLLKAGNHGAFTEIYNRYKGILLVHAYKKLGNFEEAKDIVQDMFSSLWNNRDSVPPAKNLGGYLYTLTRNKILNFIEHRKIAYKYAASFSHFAKEPYSVTELLLREKEMRDIIDKEIAALPPKMKEVFMLSRKEHLSHKQIANRLDISEFTVKNHIKSALKILRVRLGVLFIAVFISNLY